MYYVYDCVSMWQYVYFYLFLLSLWLLDSIVHAFFDIILFVIVWFQSIARSALFHCLIYIVHVFVDAILFLIV